MTREEAERRAWERAGDILLDSPLEDDDWHLERERLALRILDTMTHESRGGNMHGNLMSYRTNEPIRPATREERFDSLHAMLDDDGRGLIETDDYGTCYVECGGVICLDDRYSDGRPFDGPHDFVRCMLESWDLDLDLVLHDDGWHGPDGLLLVLA